jgi:hypothetical protein
MTQMTLPGVDPPEEKPAEADTATTVLIFADDDKVQQRVVDAMRHLFWGDASSIDSRAMTADNCAALLRQLLHAGVPTTEPLEELVRKVVSEELEQHMKEVKKEFEKRVGVKKRPSK